MQRSSEVLAVTADAALVRHLLAVTAAVGVGAEVEPDVSGLRPRWRSAAMVLVGVDRVADVAELGLPRRSGVYVLGTPADRDETHAWSARLGAAVVTLPDGAGDLAEAVADLAGDASPGWSVAVLGGSGGVGASTLAAGLAVTAARGGRRTLLVDADPLGGGLDLLLGAEHQEGWRWSRFGSARGHLGDLGGQLPHADGVDLLAMDRGAGPGLRPEQVSAVLESAARSHATTVVDLPRALDPAGEEVLRRVGLALLVVAADVRGVAAAQQVAHQARAGCRSLGVVARVTRTRGLTPETVAAALGLPLHGVLEDDPALPVGAERGEPPARAPRSALARSCRALLDDGRAGAAA